MTRQKIIQAANVSAGCSLLGLASLAIFLDRWGQRNRIENADAIVVLGAHVRADGSASGALRERVMRAVALYERGAAPHLIMTGAVGTYPPAESQVAKELAVACGVPPEAISTESESHSTWKNAIYAARICREHGWQRVILVSEPYHLRRARGNFQRQNLQVFVAPSPNYRWPRRLRMTWREAILFVRDYLLRKI